MPKHARSNPSGKDRVKVPAKGPMPMLDEHRVPEGKAPAWNKSPLGIYLRKTSKISITAFARALGVPVKTAQDWSYGVSLPTLPAAWEIERLTKGAVPMEAWLALPKAKEMLARWREHQSEEMLRLKPTEGGGF